MSKAVTGYLLEPLFPVEDFRLAWLAAVCPMLPDTDLAPVLPRVWEAFFAVTGMPVKPLVEAAAFMLLIISFALLT
jgi:hypothetical protein